MPAEKIDVERLAREARLIIDAGGDVPMVAHIPLIERFARLVLEEAAKVCDVTPPQPFRPSIEAAHAIRGMKP